MLIQIIAGSITTAPIGGFYLAPAPMVPISNQTAVDVNIRGLSIAAHREETGAKELVRNCVGQTFSF